MALMVAELATLIPEEGGYYVWVRETLDRSGRCKKRGGRSDTASHCSRYSGFNS